MSHRRTLARSFHKTSCAYLRLSGSAIQRLAMAKAVITAIASLLAAAWVSLIDDARAYAHDWYPRVCCHDNDCAPVDAVAQVTLAGDGPKQLVVKSKHGTAVIPIDFPARASMDGRMHVCMRPGDDNNMDVMCLFLPPSM